MDPAQIVDQLNAHAAAVVRTLRGRVVDFDAERQSLRMAFMIGRECCHTVDVVQGGYVTAMLDAAMAHAVLAVAGVSNASIEIHVSFLRPARAGDFIARGEIVKLGRSIAFLRAELHDATERLVATATSSVVLGTERNVR
jgi:uncharacterized protein (TIGR00369 family)